MQVNRQSLASMQEEYFRQKGIPNNQKNRDDVTKMGIRARITDPIDLYRDLLDLEELA